MVKRLISIILILSLALSNVVITYGDTTSAKVTELSGVVKVKRAGSTKEFDAFVNMTIGVGDKIRTGTSGSVTLVVDDENEVTAGKNTSFTFTDLSKVGSEPSSAYTVHYGSVANDVNKKGFAKSSYKVNTTNTVMGVRGTVFEVAKKISEDGNEAVSLVTLDGSVVVSNRVHGEDGTNSLSEIGAVTASQQIIFSNEDDNTGEVVVLDITKLSAESLSWLLENDQYLTTEQKETVVTTLVEAVKVETEKAKNIEKVIENYTDESKKTVVMVEKKDSNDKNNNSNTEVEVPGGDNTGTEGGDNTGTEGGDNTGTEGGDNTGTEGGDNTGTEGGDNTGTEGSLVDNLIDGVIENFDPDFGVDVATRYDVVINTVDDLVKLNNMINTSGSSIVRTVSIENNLDLSGITDWKPANLKGVIINGNGNTISNLRITQTSDEGKIGLFGSLLNSKITNVTLDGIITDVSNANYAGALAGTVTTSILDNVNIINSIVTGEYAGGIAGKSNVSAIRNVIVGNSILEGDYVGGVTGNLDYSKVVDSKVSKVNIFTKSSPLSEVGGIAGSAYASGIYDCEVRNNYDDEIVIGSTRKNPHIYSLGKAGGIVGAAKFTNIEKILVDTIPEINANDTVGGVVGEGENININDANVVADNFYSFINCGTIFGKALGANNINNARVVVNLITSFNQNCNGMIGVNKGQVSIADTISVLKNFDFTQTYEVENYIFNNTYYLNIQGAEDFTGLSGKTLDELLTLNWNTDIWNIVEGVIPTLK